jgi:hypothetical protein
MGEKEEKRRKRCFFGAVKEFVYGVALTTPRVSP